MFQKRVLVACPITKYKDYCLPEWLAHVSKLTYPNLDFFFVDNSKDEKYYQEVRELGFDCVRINPNKSKNLSELIVKSQNKIRDKFLSGNYDYLMSIECDQFVPIDIIEKLIIHDKPIVGIPYLIFAGSKLRSVVSKGTMIGNNFDMHLMSVNESYVYSGTGLKKAYGLGFGCLLIDRSVLEQIKYRVVDGVKMASDSFFYEDCVRERIPVYIDTDSVSFHYDGVEV